MVEDFHRLYELANNVKNDPSVIPFYSVQKLDVEHFMVELT